MSRFVVHHLQANRSVVVAVNFQTHPSNGACVIALSIEDADSLSLAMTTVIPFTAVVSTSRERTWASLGLWEFPSR